MFIFFVCFVLFRESINTEELRPQFHKRIGSQTPQWSRLCKKMLVDAFWHETAWQIENPFCCRVVEKVWILHLLSAGAELKGADP